MTEARLLGQPTDYAGALDRRLLEGIPRQRGRAALGLQGDGLPFYGGDAWTAYELSWLEMQGKPAVAVALLWVPADSPCLIESKSLKLYLGAFAQLPQPGAAAVAARIRADLSAVAQAEVEVELLAPTAWAARLQPRAAACQSLDGLPLRTPIYRPDAALLQTDGQSTQACWSSDLLRSNCPVTGQPDWGSVQICYRGPRIVPESLLAYLVSYRLHSGFHEQCVEQIFVDILRRCRCTALEVGARFTRRGGLDISPFRATAAGQPPDWAAARTWRQ